MFRFSSRVHCVGDSHLDIFQLVQELPNFKNKNFQYCIVRGATNLGLANPRSQTNAGIIFNEYLESKIRKSDTVIFCLGEVDCGFVIWLQYQNKGLPIGEQFERSLNNYKKLLTMAQSRAKSVLVISVPPPTIADGQDWGAVANARSEIQASQSDRTKLTIEYNKQIAEFCSDSGIHYIDLQSETLDENTGMVRPEFLNKDPLDHHLEYSRVLPLLERKLEEFI